MTLSRLASLASAALVVAACGGSGTGNGRMTVRLVDAPADVLALNLDIQKVEIRGPAGWQTLSEPKEIVDVKQLRFGVSKTLADQTLPAGNYSQLRLVLGPQNQVVLTDESTHDLIVPSGQQSGVKLVVSFQVVANTTKDVYIDFDAFRSIFVHETGASAKYLLRPTVRAYDKLETGAITGRIVDAASQAGLAGVEVMAETIDGSGTPSVERTVSTDATGAFVLDLLPVGGSYYVVAQPRVGSDVYAARASGPIAITEAAPTPTWNGAFSKIAQAGGISGAISSVAGDNDADVVLARQTLDAGGTPALLVVRSAVPVVTDAGTDHAAESYAIASLPPGPYSLVATRRTTDADLNTTVQVSAPVAVTVAAGPDTAAPAIGF